MNSQSLRVKHGNMFAAQVIMQPNQVLKTQSHAAALCFTLWSRAGFRKYWQAVQKYPLAKHRSTDKLQLNILHTPPEIHDNIAHAVQFGLGSSMFVTSCPPPSDQIPPENSLKYFKDTERLSEENFYFTDLNTFSTPDGNFTSSV